MKANPMSVETVSNSIRSGSVDHNEGLALIRGLIDRAIGLQMDGIYCNCASRIGETMEWNCNQCGKTVEKLPKSL